MAVRGTFAQARTVTPIAVRPNVLRIWTTLSAMARARATRRMLGEMDDRMLADIGIGRGEAITEAMRAPWDLRERRR